MGIKFKTVVVLLFIIEIVLLLQLSPVSVDFPLLFPDGIVAQQQRDLMFVIVGLMLVVAIPLLSVFYYFVYKFRATNSKRSRNGHESHSKLAEMMWWAIPSVFIVIMGIITWRQTHALDPYRPLESSVPPVRIQVIALQWKWLFLYPDYNIATVNFIQFPQKTPINFELTADAPMNSFWIPSLSGQIYAMTGMSTKLHLMANTTGEYRGQAGEINGRGFSGMNFVVKATTNEEFEEWIATVRQAPHHLSSKEYEMLSTPSENSPAMYYASYDSDLYNKIIMKFMMPSIDEDSDQAAQH